MPPKNKSVIEGSSVSPRDAPEKRARKPIDASTTPQHDVLGATIVFVSEPDPRVMAHLSHVKDAGSVVSGFWVALFTFSVGAMIGAAAPAQSAIDALKHMPHQLPVSAEDLVQMKIYNWSAAGAVASAIAMLISVPKQRRAMHKLKHGKQCLIEGNIIKPLPEDQQTKPFKWWGWIPEWFRELW